MTHHPEFRKSYWPECRAADACPTAPHFPDVMIPAISFTYAQT